VELLEESREAWGLFIASATQWRYAGMGGERAGLDYAGVRAVADARGIAWTATLLKQISDFERGALDGFAETARREAERG
jgi:hypothetical protein